MSSVSLLKQIHLKKRLNVKDIHSIIEKIVTLFNVTNNSNQREKIILQPDLDEILFTAVLFESIPKIVRDLSIDHETMENNLIQIWKDECDGNK